MNVNDFKGSFNDLARNSLFRVEINGQGIDGRQFSFRCKTASLPGTTINPIEVSYQGRKIKLAGDREYEPWNTTVMMNEEYDVHTALYDWSQVINDAEENVQSGGGQLDYKEEALITTLKRDGTEGVQYRFIGLWPQVVAPLDLTWDGGSEIAELEVTWEYDYFIKV